MQHSTSGGGGEGVGRGLARFRSAPATWLEALLESDIEQEEEEDDPLIKPPTQFQTQLKPTTQFPPTSYAEPASFDGAGGPASGVGFLRRNSTPADFLAQISGGTDGYFSSFGIPASYDYTASSVEVAPSSKRPKEADSAKFSSQLPIGMSGLLDAEMEKLLEDSVPCRVRAKRGCATHPRSIAERKVEPSGMSGLLDAEMEKLLEDSVPCRVRAKRGCATHPRSIAERVRRTRISDRIRKLQELVPNMDKQTNTADMLEEAVEYVKLLQKQIQELKEQKKNCTCANSE